MAGGKQSRKPQNGAYTTRAGNAGGYADAPDYGSPDSAYAAPDIHRDAPYNDEFGWGPRTRISVEGTPDAMREFAAPVREYGPSGDGPVNPYYRTLDADEKQRESVTETEAKGWEGRNDE